MLIGLILGDCFIEKRINNLNVRLRFRQSIIHKEYLLHLFDIFNNLCISQPKLDKHSNKITGKIHESIYFTSITLPCLNEFNSMFYNSKGTKIIPININELLTPIGLAY